MHSMEWYSCPFATFISLYHNGNVENSMFQWKWNQEENEKKNKVFSIQWQTVYHYFAQKQWETVAVISYYHHPALTNTIKINGESV